MAERETIWVEFENQYLWSDETISRTLPDAVQWLQGYLDRVPAEHRDSSVFEINYERGYYDSGDSCTLKIGYWRPETDEEATAREAEEKASHDRYAAEAQARELATYAALKRKYG